MKTLCGELKKLSRQIWGLENIFGYQSTAANQLFAFYCFIGKIYFTDKIHPWVKYFWYGLVLSEILFSFAIGAAYLLYDSQNDLMMMFNVANAIGANTCAAFGFPLISYLCSRNIDAMIELVDDIMKSDDNTDPDYGHQSRTIGGKTVFMPILGPLAGGVAIYSLIGIFDVGLFFEEEKVKDYLYYTYPVPLIQKYGNSSNFFYINAVSIFIFGLSMVQLMSALAIVLRWNAVCRNELSRIINEFNDGTSHLNKSIQQLDTSWASWNADFEIIIKRGILRFQRTVLLINYLRGYVEGFGSILVPVVFFYGGVSILYFQSSEQIPFVVKMKFLSCYWCACVVGFQFYWVGQNLNNLISDVSMAIYFTPWYQSVKVRRNVYILLCQTQSVKNLKIFKVYRLLLNNFSRYLHAILSYMNFLRRIISK